MFLKFIIFCCFLVNYICAQNYCDTRIYCANHIACNNNGQWDSSCRSPSMISMTQARINTILNTHNTLRSRVASGSLPGFKPAVRMQTLQWDWELAKLASLNVLQCRMQHDKCRSTAQFPYAGQNLAILYTTASQIDVDDDIPKRIQSWFSEYQYATQSDVDNFNGQTLHQIGHFTAMIHEKAGRVGCAASTFVTNMNGGNWNTFLFACDYSYTNVLNSPIYRSGSSCSQCQTGCNPMYKGLCSSKENVPAK